MADARKLVERKAESILTCLPKEDEELMRTYLWQEREAAAEWGKNQVMAFNIFGLVIAGAVIGLLIMGGMYFIPDSQWAMKYEVLQKRCAERVACPCLEEL